MNRFTVDVPPGDYKLGDVLPGNAAARIVGVEPTGHGARLALELPADVAEQLLNLDASDNPTGEPLPVGQDRSVWVAG